MLLLVSGCMLSLMFMLLVVRWFGLGWWIGVFIGF